MCTVLHGCETWSVILREEHRLRLFDSRVLREAVWPVRHKVTRNWKRLHDEVLYDLYHSPNIIQVPKLRGMKTAGHVALWETV